MQHQKRKQYFVVMECLGAPFTLFKKIRNYVDTNLLKYINFTVLAESYHHVEYISHDRGKKQKLLSRTSNRENLILELATYHDGRPEKPVMGTQATAGRHHPQEVVFPETNTLGLEQVPLQRPLAEAGKRCPVRVKPEETQLLLQMTVKNRGRNTLISLPSSFSLLPILPAGQNIRKL